MIATIAPFVAGLGLFFCGVHFIAANVTQLVGRRLRAVLMRVAGHPSLAAISGIVAGMITQSSNAVVFIASGLVSAGIIDKRRAMLVPTWSQVGSSVIVILVAIDLRIAASYAVAIAGFAIYFGFARNDRMRHTVHAVLGAGLLFLGLEMLKSGAGPIRDLLIADGAVQYATKAPLLLFLFGTGLTIACQSAHVTSAIAVAAVNIGLVDFSAACLLVYGANLGSLVNYYLLAASMSGESRQITLMQVAQKIAGFVGILPIVVAEVVTGRPFFELAAGVFAATVGGKVAFVFLYYQAIGCLLCTVGFAPLVALLERLSPPTKLQELSRPAFLVDEALVEPALAVDLVGREERRLLGLLPTMLDSMRADAVEGEARPTSSRAPASASRAPWPPISRRSSAPTRSASTASASSACSTEPRTSARCSTRSAISSPRRARRANGRRAAASPARWSRRCMRCSPRWSTRSRRTTRPTASSCSRCSATATS